MAYQKKIFREYDIRGIAETELLDAAIADDPDPEDAGETDLSLAGVTLR